jgi:PTH1 family peptidyl-tRNA hydrolase
MDSSDYKWLIVGLGNPGSRYAETRHNIGWMVAASLCRKYGRDPRLVQPYYYLADMEVSGSRILVSFPVTYMNESGKAVRYIANKYGIETDKILIIVDEYNFPVGKVHLKKGGSDGGHNGTASVIEKLGSSDFWRLRCGIARNFPPGMLVDYVLSRFDKHEVKDRDIMTDNAVEAIVYLVKEGSARAMSEINSGRLFNIE